MKRLNEGAVFIREDREATSSIDRKSPLEPSAPASKAELSSLPSRDPCRFAPRQLPGLTATRPSNVQKHARLQWHLDLRAGCSQPASSPVQVRRTPGERLQQPSSSRPPPLRATPALLPSTETPPHP